MDAPEIIERTKAYNKLRECWEHANPGHTPCVLGTISWDRLVHKHALCRAYRVPQALEDSAAMFLPTLGREHR